MPHRSWRGDPLALLRGTMSDPELACLLDTLIRAERSSADSITPFLAAVDPGTRPRLALVQRFAIRNIATLACIVRRLGREPAPPRPPLPEAPLTPRSVRARVELVSRGEAWMARQVEAALPRVADRAVRDALGVVRETHVLTIGICRAILADLGGDRDELNEARSAR